MNVSEMTVSSAPTFVTRITRNSPSHHSPEDDVKRLHLDSALLADGWRSDVLVTLDGSTIAAIAADVPAPPDAERLGGIAIAGMPNVHSHAFQRAMAGLAERHAPGSAEGSDAVDSFWTWREVMYRFLARMTPDDIEAATALAYVEMLEAGFTRVGEFHYLHNAADGARYADPAETAGRIVAAARASGIGLTLLPCFYAHGGCGGAPPKPGQARFLSGFDGFVPLMEASRAHVAGLDGARIGVAPHSLRAVDAPELGALCAAFATGPIHIHAAEQEQEVAECIAWSGARPVQWLLDNVPVDERWCLVHATHMTADETLRLARSGAVAGLCPITESSLGDGIFPAVTFTQGGGRIAVGTDSNVRIAANEEMRTLEYSQRLRDRRRNCLGGPGASTGRAIYEAARGGGAQALGLGMADRCGGLAVGQAADIVVLDATHPALAGRAGDSALDAWIFAAGPVVRRVIAGGRHVVSDGRHVAADAVRARYAATARRLLADA
jgi:formiminoglutamate deiminase